MKEMTEKIFKKCKIQLKITLIHFGHNLADKGNSISSCLPSGDLRNKRNEICVLAFSRLNCRHDTPTHFGGRNLSDSSPSDLPDALFFGATRRKRRRREKWRKSETCHFNWFVGVRCATRRRSSIDQLLTWAPHPPPPFSPVRGQPCAALNKNVLKHFPPKFEFVKHKSIFRKIFKKNSKKFSNFFSKLFQFSNKRTKMSTKQISALEEARWGGGWGVGVAVVLLSKGHPSDGPIETFGRARWISAV